MSRYILFILISLLTVSCGEIELPQPDHAEQTTDNSNEDQESGNVNKEDNNGTNEEGNQDNNGENEDNNQNENENEGDNSGNQPSEGINFGRASITADGHLLIDDRLYVSLLEIPDVPSAYSDSPTLAFEYAQEYSEGELTNWRIPTLEDVGLLRDVLAYIDAAVTGKELLATINKELEKRGERGIYHERYLCDEAMRSFNFSSEGIITKASSKTLYRLRLVCDK